MLNGTFSNTMTPRLWLMILMRTPLLYLLRPCFVFGIDEGYLMRDGVNQYSEFFQLTL